MGTGARIAFVVVPLAALGLVAWGMAWALGVRHHATPLPVLASLPPLSAQDAAGAPVDLARLRGQLWVASVVRGAEPEPGAPILRALRELQNTFKKTGSQVLLVTLCPDASPAALHRLGERAGLPPERWLALCGPGLAAFVRDGLAAPAGLGGPGSDPGAPDRRLFLVDRQGRLRTVQDGLTPGGMALLKSDVGNLLREPPGGS